MNIHLSLSEHHDVDPKMNSTFPWHTYHTKYGLLKYHPIPMNTCTIGQELFLLLFQVPFNADKNQKNTFYHMPNLENEDDIFFWY